MTEEDLFINDMWARMPSIRLMSGYMSSVGLPARMIDELARDLFRHMPRRCVAGKVADLPPNFYITKSVINDNADPDSTLPSDLKSMMVYATDPLWEWVDRIPK